MFAYASYRDPNLLETLQVYDQSGAFLRDYPISSDELTKAIIGTIGDFDAYQLPDAKGYASLVRYLTGIDDDYRQQMRDQVLGTKAEYFCRFCRRAGSSWRSGPGRSAGVGGCDCRGVGCARQLADAGQGAVSFDYWQNVPCRKNYSRDRLGN